MSKGFTRAALLIIAGQPLVTTGILWALDGGVTCGTVVASVICSLVQAVLLLILQFTADQTDKLAREAHGQITEAANTDFAELFEDGLK